MVVHLTTSTDMVVHLTTCSSHDTPSHYISNFTFGQSTNQRAFSLTGVAQSELLVLEDLCFLFPFLFFFFSFFFFSFPFFLFLLLLRRRPSEEEEELSESEEEVESWRSWRSCWILGGRKKEVEKLS